MTTRPFAALGVPADLRAQLDAIGIVEPFPIQSAVIPDALAGRDVTGRAPTGSGKTLAFGLPVVAGLRSASNRRPTALILAPTRELADQIATELRPFVRARNHAVVTAYGGVGYGPQRKALSAGAELVVACPGRLEDLLQMGASRSATSARSSSTKPIGWPTWDSCRRCGGSSPRPIRPPGAAVLGHARRGGRRSWLGKCQRDPVRHEVGPTGPDISAARHVFWDVDRTERPARRRSWSSPSGRRWCSAALAMGPIGWPSNSARSVCQPLRSTADAASRSATGLCVRSSRASCCARRHRCRGSWPARRRCRRRGPLRSAGRRQHLRAPVGPHGPRRGHRRRRVAGRARHDQGGPPAAAGHRSRCPHHAGPMSPRCVARSTRRRMASVSAPSAPSTAGEGTGSSTEAQAPTCSSIGRTSRPAVRSKPASWCSSTCVPAARAPRRTTSGCWRPVHTGP